MDVDNEPYTVYVMCPKCGEVSLQQSNEYPIVCCNLPGMTFGTGKCCRCNIPIPVDSEQLDLCFICQFATTHIK